MALNTDYTQLANQLKLDNANSLLGQTGAPSIAGISGDLLQDWANLGANSGAYKKLLEAEKTGSIKKNNVYSTELMSDKYFNDYYDSKTGKIKKATYTPSSSAQPGLQIDEESTSDDILGDMRSLALAAISNPNNLNHNHYDFFEKMRSTIAKGLVKGDGDSASTVTEPATAAKATKDFDYRLLLEDQSFTVAGAKGEKSYTFGSGTSIEEIAAAINADSGETGVKAAMVETDDGTLRMELTSVATGKDAFVRVDQTRGDLFAESGKSLAAAGKDPVEKKAEETASGEKTQAAIAAGLYTGKTFEDIAFTLAGTEGSKSFSFEQGATAEDIVAAINEASEDTGVRAEVIKNALGEVEGIGLLAAKAGRGNYIQVKQDKGSLFTQEGKMVNVEGSTLNTDGEDEGGPAITSEEDLGKVSIDGVTYSFADLAPGGKASLANNPEAALAVLDKTLSDIYNGRAQIEGFDSSTMYMRPSDRDTGRDDSTNAFEYGNFGSDAMSNWIGKYAREAAE